MKPAATGATAAAGWGAAAPPLYASFCAVVIVPGKADHRANSSRGQRY